MRVRFLRQGGNGGGRDDGNGTRGAPIRRDARTTTTTDDLPPIPEKIYFRIGEVAHLVGVEPHVLRYWEHEFRSIRPTKSQRGQRVYSRRDVEHLRRIRTLLYEQGFTIAGAKKALRGKGLEPRDEGDPTLIAGTKAREALLAMRGELAGLHDELTAELAAQSASSSASLSSASPPRAGSSSAAP